MKSIFFVSALLALSQPAFCQSTKIKSGVKSTNKTASVTTTPHRNLNLPVVYTFVGDGNWSNVNNWDMNGIPPADISPGSEIRINTAVPGGKCILDVPYEVPNTTNTIKLTVYTGNQLVVPSLTVK